ncbi:UTRA domain-containing protein [Tistrella bauzanensis]
MCRPAASPGWRRSPPTTSGPALSGLLRPVRIFVARAIDDVSFATADAGTAALLGITEGDPVAEIERTAFTIDGTAIEWRIARGNARNFRYRSRIG